MIWAALSLGIGCRTPDLGPTEAQRFASAADPSTETASALEGCRGIAKAEPRGDCLSLALETHKAATRRDCASIESERWKGECYFVLAEKERGQDLAQATETCSLSSYARECMEHLIKSEAKLVVDQDPLEQQATLSVLQSSPVAEDAGVIFWQEWALLRVEADLMVSRLDCRGLVDEGSCSVGMKRAGKELIRAGGLENRCKAAAAGRPLLALSDGRAVLDSGVPLMPSGGACSK